MVSVFIIGYFLLVVFLVLFFLRKRNGLDKGIIINVALLAILFAVVLAFLKPWLWIK